MALALSQKLYPNLSRSSLCSYICLIPGIFNFLPDFFNDKLSPCDSGNPLGIGHKMPHSWSMCIFYSLWLAPQVQSYPRDHSSINFQSFSDHWNCKSKNLIPTLTSESTRDKLQSLRKTWAHRSISSGYSLPLRQLRMEALFQIATRFFWSQESSPTVASGYAVTEDLISVCSVDLPELNFWLHDNLCFHRAQWLFCSEVSDQTSV